MDEDKNVSTFTSDGNCLEGFLFRNETGRGSKISIKSGQHHGGGVIRSVSIKDRMELLRSGTVLKKIRDKGLRGIQLYERNFWLDMENLLIHFSPHKHSSTNLGCSTVEATGSYNLSDVCEVREGCQTDIFNKIQHGKGCRSFDNIDEKTSFSIIFKPDSEAHVLDLVAEDEEVRDMWVDALRHLIVTLVSLSNQKEYELYLKNQFRKADANGSGHLDFSETKELCNSLNIKLSREDFKKLFDAANTEKTNPATNEKGEVLDEDEFVAFYYKLMRRPEIDDLFHRYSNKERMTVNELDTFLKEEQKVQLLLEECREIIKNFETSENKTAFTMEGFTHFLMFNEWQEVISPILKSQVKSDDMVHPLAHYWIASSHNTYLTGNQLTGKSSVDGYISALKQGCRCLELDCWDGDDGEPIIYHGHTLTTKILFKDVIAVCKEFGFIKSDFPLILSLENHCSLQQQDRMADILLSVLGDMLFVDKIKEAEIHLPSPRFLRRKILVKAKKSKFESKEEGSSEFDVDDDTDEDDNDSDSVDGSNKRKHKKVSIKLSNLVNYIHAVKFPGFDGKDAKFFHMSSFKESKVKRILSDLDTARNFVSYNTKQISRIYPGTKRQDSSNLKIMEPWSAGCQIVSLNYQTEDRQNHLNRAMFKANAGCGYILKPKFLRDAAINYSPISPSGLDRSLFPILILSIEILSGQHIPRPKGVDEGEIIDPYVEVRIRGHPDDYYEPENRKETKAVRNNGFNPTWREAFVFTLKVPDLAILDLKVKDHSRSGKDQHLGSYAVRVIDMQEGYRRAYLVDYSGRELKPASLFLKINKRWIK